MYGAGLEGKNIIVIDTEYGGIEDILMPSRTPSNLVNKKGRVIHCYDDRYDTPRPTGYERITLVVKTQEGEEFNIDSDCVRKIT